MLEKVSHGIDVIFDSIGRKIAEYPLEDAKIASDLVHEGRILGKIVLKI